MTKLIMVEGLPGSGKTTTAFLLEEILKESGINTVLFPEGDRKHPADYDGVAYFDYEDYHSLEAGFQEEKDVLNQARLEIDGGWLIPYREATEEKGLSFSESLFARILQRDIYELPLQKHMDLIAERWRGFTENCLDDNQVVIFECCFIQNPVTVTMIREGVHEDVSKAYVKCLEKIIEPLEPFLVYLDRDDPGKSFMDVFEERPSEWLDGFVAYYTNQGYGKQYRLTGIEGVIEVLNRRKALELDILASLDLGYHRLNNSEVDVDTLKDQLKHLVQGIGLTESRQ